MANTVEGRLLTDQNRRYQALLGATMVGVTMDLAKLLDPTDIEGTFERWLEQQIGALEAVKLTSTQAAAKYVTAYRVAEIGAKEAAKLPIVVPEVDLLADVDAMAWAPPVAHAAIKAGQDPVSAWNDVAKQLAWKTQNLAMSSGRSVVSRSAEKHGGRWRRVSDGNPCAWCAMLVTRGPVYKRETVVSTHGGRKYHYACGCVPEEVFGEWEPTAEEQEYIDLYHAVHQGGDTDKDVAARMREYGQGIINDARVIGTQTSGAGGGKPPNTPGGIASGAVFPSGSGSSSGGQPPPPVPWILLGGSDDWPYWLDPLTEERWWHIWDDHGPYSTKGKPKFKPDTDIGQAIFDTIRHGEDIFDRNGGKIKKLVVNGQIVVVVMRPNKRGFFIITACPDE